MEKKGKKNINASTKCTFYLNIFRLYRVFYCVIIKFSVSVPGPPSRVQAIPVSKQTIRIIWDAPVEPNGIIRTYLLYYSKTVSDPLLINSNKVTELRISGNTTSEYLPLLESDTEYFFWVKASTSVGVGNASTVVRQTTKDKSKCTRV